MNNPDFAMFVWGLILAGAPCGLVSAWAWTHLTKKPEAALIWFLVTLFAGGMLGFLLGIPLTAVSVYFAHASGEADKLAISKKNNPQ